MTAYREPEYYLTIASRLEQAGVKFVLSHYIDAQEEYLGGDDKLGPGFFWTAYNAKTGHNFRVKRITTPKEIEGNIWESPERVPVTDAAYLTHRNVKHAFRELLDAIMEDQMWEMSRGPEIGPYNAVQLTALFDPRFGV